MIENGFSKMNLDLHGLKLDILLWFMVGEKLPMELNIGKCKTVGVLNGETMVNSRC